MKFRKGQMFVDNDDPTEIILLIKLTNLPRRRWSVVSIFGKNEIRKESFVDLNDWWTEQVIEDSYKPLFEVKYDET